MIRVSLPSVKQAPKRSAGSSRRRGALLPRPVVRGSCARGAEASLEALLAAALAPSMPITTRNLESRVADVLQCAAHGKSDRILAARLLSRFAPEEMPWAPVDLSSDTRRRPRPCQHRNHRLRRALCLELILKQDILKSLEGRQ